MMLLPRPLSPLREPQGSVLCLWTNHLQTQIRSAEPVEGGGGTSAPPSSSSEAVLLGFNHKYPQAASLLEVAAPSPSTPALNVFVRRFQKAALSFTWHEVEVWRLKAPAGKLVLIVIS